MEWALLTEKDYITKDWSGGTTTQLAIAPEGAQYADRNFLWRISSAKVALDHSDFTALPDYNRFLIVLAGNLDLKVGGEARATLPRLTVYPFDGGVHTESWGKCTDFNLMIRKGCCKGEVRPLTLGAGNTMILPREGCGDYPELTLALFCVSGTLTVSGTGLTARPGDLLLCREGESDDVRLAAETRTEFIAIFIHSRSCR